VQLAEKYTPNEVPLASALNISAFNVGITFASTAGGIAVSHNQILNTPFIGIIMLIVGIILIWVLMRMESGTVTSKDLNVENC
jgi:Arabinose efflux permease